MDDEKVFKERCRDFFMFLDEIDRLETALRNNELPIGLSFTTLAVNRASSFILFYNIIESTITQSYMRVKGAIGRDRKNIGRFRKAWQLAIIEHKVGQQLRDGAKNRNILDQFAEIIRNEKSHRKSWAESESLPFSGNIDQVRLLRWCRSVGMDIALPQMLRGDSFLETICRHRNELAHGKVSFDQIGNLYTIRELKDGYLRARCFLKILVRNSQVYTIERRFLR